MSYSPSILDIGGLNRFVFDNVESQITTPLDEVDQTEIQEVSKYYFIHHK